MFAVLLAASLAAPQEKEKPKELPEAAKKELKALEGKWKLVKIASSAGESEPPATEREPYLLFKGDVLTMEAGDKQEVVKVTALDPSTTPKCIDLTKKQRDDTERTVEAVYKIDKDTLLLALCVSKDGRQRPTGFDKPTDDRTMVWTLKRAKD